MLPQKKNSKPQKNALPLCATPPRFAHPREKTFFCLFLPVVVCRGKKYISSSSGCIGEGNWRDIIIAILCENPISNISFRVIAYHRHERPVRRTGRPAKRAGTHRGTIVARKDDVLPMVREETGFLDDAFLLVFFFLFPNVFLSLSH